MIVGALCLGLLVGYFAKGINININHTHKHEQPEPKKEEKPQVQSVNGGLSSSRGSTILPTNKRSKHFLMVYTNSSN
jgi:hypothetical protein